MKLPPSLKRMLSALAHAHAGEYLSPRQKAHALSGRTPEAPIVVERKPEAQPQRGRIGLYLGSDLPDETLEYVSQTCIRLDHDLVVFSLQDEASAGTFLDPLRTRIEPAGLRVELAPIRGEPERALARALGRRPEVVFLVCNEAGHLGHRVLDGRPGECILPVPVVLVAARGEQNSARTGERDESTAARAA